MRPELGDFFLAPSVKPITRGLELFAPEGSVGRHHPDRDSMVEKMAQHFEQVVCRLRRVLLTLTHERTGVRFLFDCRLAPPSLTPRLRAFAKPSLVRPVGR
jgi:hypothetical protein